MKRISAFLLVVVMLFAMSACSEEPSTQDTSNTSNETSGSADTSPSASEQMQVNVPDNFVLIKGGTFEMGSPDTEAWRSDDETQHTVTVSDFYMNIYELTQAEYREITEENPSSFSGDDLPVENISWLDAVLYCNARSEKENLTPVYAVDGQNVTWDRSANGTDCLRKQNGSTPAVQEQQRRSTPKIPSAPKHKPIQPEWKAEHSVYIAEVDGTISQRICEAPTAQHWRKIKAASISAFAL